MKRSLICLLAAVAVLGAFVSGSCAQPRELFNGKNLDNWYTFVKERGVNTDPNQVFTVQDGMIRISGAELGCITTNESFKNYRLILEYKWGQGKPVGGSDLTWARDSGVLLHSQGEDGAWHGTWMCSIEANIIEGGMGDFIVVGDGSDKFQITANIRPEKQGSCGVWDLKGCPSTINSGRINWYGRDPEWTNTVDFKGKNDLDKPIGEWNRMEILCKDAMIYVFFNGKLVNFAYNVRPSEGKIQIQSENAEIFFRKITIETLE